MSTVTKPQQTNTQLVQKEERVMEYIPFGSDEAIKLSVSIIQNMVCIPTKSGAICTERDAMKFMMLCKARALNPFEGDAFLQGYDAKDGAVFSLITAHQAFLKRAEPHPEFAGMRSGIVVNDPIVCPACKGAGERPNGKPCKACDEIGVTDELIGDIIPANAKLLGGWAIVYFKNRPEPMHKRVALSVFRKPFGR
ncbi:MAG TPA: recombinase RecT, partial [Polyangiaceae bacterium]|nr:recombinase RecT [Polyangiaceae bacterium]